MSTAGRSSSLPPAKSVTRVGRSARAEATCSTRTCRRSFPRTARLAYRKSGSRAASCSAARSAQPRTPFGKRGSSSPTPSVNESPTHTILLLIPMSVITTSRSCSVTSADVKALIIGGGVAGAVTAVALRKAGILSVVHEAYPTGADDIGAFLTIMGNGMDALRAVDLHQAVVDVAFPATAVELRNSDFEVLGRSPTTGYTVKRAELYRVLHNAMD